VNALGGLVEIFIDLAMGLVIAVLAWVFVGLAFAFIILVLGGFNEMIGEELLAKWMAKHPGLVEVLLPFIGSLAVVSLWLSFIR